MSKIHFELLNETLPEEMYGYVNTALRDLIRKWDRTQIKDKDEQT